MTSVILSSGTGITVSDSGTAIITSGTRTISLADAYGDTKNPYGTKTPNYVLAGPSSGSTAAAPTFRALVEADIPSLTSSKISDFTNSAKTAIGIGSGSTFLRKDGSWVSIAELPTGTNDSDILTWNAEDTSASWTAPQSVQANPFYVPGSGSTAAVTSGSTYAARWRGTNSRIDALTTGTLIYYRIDVAGNGTYGTVLSLNGGNEHPVVRNVNTSISTAYAVGSIVPLIYDAAQSASVYRNGASTSLTGCWKIADYDSNTIT